LPPDISPLSADKVRPEKNHYPRSFQQGRTPARGSSQRNNHAWHSVFSNRPCLCILAAERVHEAPWRTPSPRNAYDSGRHLTDL